MFFNDRRKKMNNPVIAKAMDDIKVARSDRKTAESNYKSSIKAVKKAGAYTSEFKAVMKGGNPVIGKAKDDIKSARSDRKTAASNYKSSIKAVKKAGAYTPEFKAVMKGK